MIGLYNIVSDLRRRKECIFAKKRISLEKIGGNTLVDL
jgi:hypothetical protein